MDWKELAVKWADRLGVPRSIVLTTVEAETGGRNVLGDAGQAMGYGQVWVSKWHYDDLEFAARELGISTIPAREDVQGLQTLITSNDELSMALAAKTIKDFWESAGGDFIRFVKGYVGPKVPEAEIQRRQKILKKYREYDVVPADTGKSVLELPQGRSKEYLAWFLIGVGVLIMIKVLGGDAAEVRQKALEVYERV